jgi:preprotein translocase subunit YajC
VKAVAQLLPFVVIAALFWFLLIRPAQRRQREQRDTQRAAAVGSEVMLTSGIFGTVTGADDETLQLEVAPGMTMKVARGAVARVLNEEPDEELEQQADDSTTSGPEGQ